MVDEADAGVPRYVMELEDVRLQPEDPRSSEKRVKITVFLTREASFVTEPTHVYEVHRWAVRDGVLILIRSLPGNPPDRTHIPLTSIAKWEVTR